MKTYLLAIYETTHCYQVFTIEAWRGLTSPLGYSDLIRVFLLSILFLCALFINGCDATEATPYPILDSGFGSGDQQVYWLDDDHVLFSGYEGDKPKTVEEKEQIPWGIYIWNVKSNTVWLFARNGHHYCYHNGKIYYAQDFKKIYWVVDWENTKKTGEIHPQSIEVDKVDYLSMNCLRRMRPPGTEGRAVFPLLEGHGYLDEGPMRGKISNNTPITYYPHENTAGIVLPIGRRQVERIRYFEFKNAYLMSGPYYNEEKKYAESWPAGSDRPIWWLYSDGRIDRIVVPFKGSKLGSSISFIGTKRGLFLISHAIGKDYETPGNAGGFLLSDNNLVKIIAGIIDGAAVSSDGCRVAFAHVPNLAAMRPGTVGRRTLQIVELCSE